MTKYVEIEKINPWVIAYSILFAIQLGIGLYTIREIDYSIIGGGHLIPYTLFLLLGSLLFSLDRLSELPLFVIKKFPIKEGKKL